MLTPKEEAERLFDKFDIIHYQKLGSKDSKGRLPVSMYKSQRKQCVLFCIEEQTEMLDRMFHMTSAVIEKERLEKVKKEAEKL